MDVSRLEQIPAVSGYEQELIEEIRSQLRGRSPKSDKLGSLWVSFGNGSPHRLLVTSVDEPGYIVSEITPDGFLRVQRLPQAAPNPVFDTLHFAQPIWVMTRSGKRVSGVFAGLSVHLQPARMNPPKMNHPDEMYVDIGASSDTEVRAAGVELLDPIALNRSGLPFTRNSMFERAMVSGPATGDRFGTAILLGLARRLNESKVSGTTTIAFVTQQWTGGRGFERLLNEIRPDEVVLIGRLRVASSSTSPSPAKSEHSGILLGVSDASVPLAEFAAQFKSLADAAQLPLAVVSAIPPRMGGYATPTPLAARFVQLGIETRWPVTPAETISLMDLGKVSALLESFLKLSPQKGGFGISRGEGGKDMLLADLSEVYGPSGHENAVRERVKMWLARWAKTETDSAGNLALHLGDAKPESKSPHLAFVAHMDEIGYEVKKIEDDGRLLASLLGGGYAEYFLGHVVLIHKSDGTSTGGVLELPAGWDQAGFEWAHGPRSLDETVHVYVGTRSTEETQKLGIKVGDWITIPKEYRPLLGKRANARSFDDRVGCAALVEAVNALGPDLPGRDVTFIWSTEEEVGLKGAAAAAERMAKEGRAPDFVFAIDTFVSSDSPLESKRFADAEIGKGFVIRAVDNSNITPREYVDRVVKLARENSIPVQFGVTGGGNDGAVFTRYGSVDIPLGWPLRYSHSPGEVIDIRDLDALSKIIAVLAKNW
jgi:putative aminopeptidase FrvX